jgi:hypothetical protein
MSMMSVIIVCICDSAVCLTFVTHQRYKRTESTSLILYMLSGNLTMACSLKYHTGNCRERSRILYNFVGFPASNEGWTLKIIDQ